MNPGPWLCPLLLRALRMAAEQQAVERDSAAGLCTGNQTPKDWS